MRGSYVGTCDSAIRTGDMLTHDVIPMFLNSPPAQASAHHVVGGFRAVSPYTTGRSGSKH